MKKAANLFGRFRFKLVGGIQNAMAIGAVQQFVTSSWASLHGNIFIIQHFLTANEERPSVISRIHLNSVSRIDSSFIDAWEGRVKRDDGREGL